MPFAYERDVLHCEGVPLPEICTNVGTPCYVYSQADIIQRYRAYDAAFDGVPHKICYSVKANSNLSILRVLAAEGSSFDIVSGGELFRVLRAGGDPRSIVFAGVGKMAEEIEYALRENIFCLNCESQSELDLINRLAGGLGKKARVALRVNPDVDAATHPYISTGMSEHKFGIDISEAPAVYGYAASLPNVEVAGVSCHIGSQILDPDPLMIAVEKVLALIDGLRATGIDIHHLDIGGGLGVPYRPGDADPQISTVMSSIRQKVRHRGLQVMVEPGRSLVAAAGALLTRVLHVKQTSRKHFIVVDAAMNDLIRPALYKSHHEILPVERRADRELLLCDVVGPVCETGDFLARSREMSLAEAGELLAVQTAGAYGFVQSSNYNSRPRAAEVLVSGEGWQLIRRRETYDDLIRGE